MDPEKLWTPSETRVSAARITSFVQWLRSTHRLALDDYESLWRWSITDLEGFWGAVWQYFGIAASRPYSRVIEHERMPGARWFIGAELNFVDQVFARAHPSAPAIVYESEAGGTGMLSWTELREQTAALAAALCDLGVGPGDRVAAYLPNIPQTVVAFLATASLGAIWSVCAPDMGPVSVSDRFEQIEPKALIVCDGYRFAGRAYDRRDVVQSVLSRLSSVQGLIWVSHLDPQGAPPPVLLGRRVLAWGEALHAPKPVSPRPLPSDHPLWILYSSGTTGLPKPIVHGHAGIILNGLLTAAIHSDIAPGDRVFWTSSTSWMVWNAHVITLLAGATLVLFDGSPSGPGASADWNYLWRLADRHRVHLFGSGAAFFHACLKAGVVPRDHASLEALRTIASTGSPLSIEGHRWLYSAIKPDVWVNCISGGTDICGAFLAGVPTLPVYAGEMQCRALGAAVHAFNDAGESIVNEIGELVCTRPLPSMPLFFWGDVDNARYRESYFEMFSDPHGGPIWRHGDWLQLRPHPGAVGGIIHGRSDATINRQGIRMGTSELYGIVEALDEVLDSLVVDLEHLGQESYMALFVVLRPGQQLTDALEEKLRTHLRSGLSPRHVPDEILHVAEVPRTLTGKKLEVPIKRLLMGHSLESAVKRDALANPASLDWYVDFARTRAARRNTPQA
jgi:acetoacetyl-CoA synthetase